MGVHADVFTALETSWNPNKSLLVFTSTDKLMVCFTELKFQMMEWVRVYQLFYMSFKMWSKDI